MLSGNWKASGTVIATIMAAPYRRAPARTARRTPWRPLAQLADPAGPSASMAAPILAIASMAAMKMIGITVAL